MSPKSAPKRSGLSGFLIFLSLLLLSTITGYPQSKGGNASQQNPTTQRNPGQVYESSGVLKTTTRLVILDVVAKDNNDHSVKDLKADEFTVLEEGQEQKITDMSFHEPPPRLKTVAPPPKGILTNVPEYRDNSCLNIILLDALNTDFSNRAYAQDMLIKYMASEPAIQPTAVLALDGKLRLLHDFTTDTKVLKDVLAHYMPKGVFTHIDTVYASASRMGVSGSFQNSDLGRDRTLSAMNYLAHALGGYHGRKNLIWVSDGFPINLVPDASTGSFGTSDYSALVEKVADALLTAQVAVYPIDAAGTGRGGNFSSHNTMTGMAERTGGKTYFNRNDIEVGVQTSIDDGSTYYTLEYYPKNKNWDDKFRRIKVQVSRPGVKLRYREGYYAVSPEASRRADLTDVRDDFSHAMDINSPTSTAVLFQAAAVPPAGKTPNTVVVNFAIDPHTITFETGEDGLQHATINCVAWAYPQKGDPVRSEGSSNAALKPEVYKQVMSSYYPCQRTLELKSGHYTLRLGVLDRITNLIGTTTTQLTVP